MRFRRRRRGGGRFRGRRRGSFRRRRRGGRNFRPLRLRIGRRM